MTLKDSIDSRFFRRSVWSGLMLVLVAVLTVAATSTIQAYFEKKALRKEAEMRTESELKLVSQKIENATTSVEEAARNLAWAGGFILSDPDVMNVPIRHMLESMPIIADGAIAFAEGYYPSKGRWYEPLIARRGYTVEEMVLGSEEHDYFVKEWFTETYTSGECHWSEPYFDESGGKTTVVTFSAPVRDSAGLVVGVAGADITLEWLDILTKEIQLYPDSYFTITSGDGTLLAGPSEIPEVSKPLHFTSEIGSTGWKLSAVIPEDSIYSDVQRMTRWLLLLQLLGLAMLIIILRSAFKDRLKYEEVRDNKNRMQDELQIAHDIQMSMLPKTFPVFPERNDLDIFAEVVPAKEVGGDMYDFFIRNEKLFFCIGDVSGKGVPASLIMAMTRSLFRTVSARERSPMRIVSVMNESMSEMNEYNMFVTFFCGILDLQTGHLRYCNAGHNAPLLISDRIRTMPVVSNIPLGIVSGMMYKEQEMDILCGESIFLYTDGIVEAEDSEHHLFGEKRMEKALKNAEGNCKDILKALNEAVSDFTGDAVQSDDITSLIIQYKNDMIPDSFERHLILHNDIQQIPQLADFIETIAHEVGMDKSLAMSVNLALEEAVTNVIMYAYPKGSDGYVDIEAILKKGTVDFTITDSGVPFDPTTVPDADINAALDDRPVGGLGIFLVKSIMDSVHYERKDEKNILSMTKRI